MQKKVIALAVAGLVSGSAFAQSNVTIYGLVDVGVTYVTADGKNSGWAIDNGLLSGSRLGFKGQEDLGNGLKAIFTLEYMLQPDANTGVGAIGPWTGSASRQTYAGLSSDKWGTVVAGRLQGAGYNFTCAFNGPFAGSAFDTIGKLGLATTLSCGTGGRHNDAVAYVSPNFSGFSFEYNHARVTEEATRGVAIASPAVGANDMTDDNYANNFGLNYANGPLKIGGVYAAISRRANNGNTGAGYTGTDNDIDEWGLGASYDFGVAKIYGSWQNQDVDNTPAASGDKYSLGVTVPVLSKGAVSLGYAKSSVDVGNSDADAWALLFTYDLSKRTTLYTGYTALSNDGAAGRGIVTATTAINGIGQPMFGGDASVFAAGIRHSF